MFFTMRDVNFEEIIDTNRVHDTSIENIIEICSVDNDY